MTNLVELIPRQTLLTIASTGYHTDFTPRSLTSGAILIKGDKSEIVLTWHASGHISVATKGGSE